MSGFYISTRTTVMATINRSVDSANSRTHPEGIVISNKHLQTVVKNLLDILDRGTDITSVIVKAKYS
ncbi:MAG: hypothetical protein IJV42_10965 [Bacteroidaceae bacterium]|nr:hypothetical protein [Bacteroidaceae bacterium]